jgi:hypothetical protein
MRKGGSRQRWPGALRAALPALLVAALLAACSSDDEVQLYVRGVSGAAVKMNGTWSGCAPTGASTSYLETLVFSVSKGTYATLDFGASPLCASGTYTVSKGAFTALAGGDKSVAWDAAGLGAPAGLSDPIQATRVSLALEPDGGTAATLNTVMLVDDRTAFYLLYLKDTAAAGPVGADGYPDEISQLPPLLRF